MEVTEITIPTIVLRWSDWFVWSRFHLHATRDKDGLAVPDGRGVYEARLSSEAVRLTIGRAANLRMRVKQGLVRGKVPHSAGEGIRAGEDMSVIVIRWAETDRPAAAEEELHLRHIAEFGRLPKYTGRS
jgi:hypothetical protein